MTDVRCVKCNRLLMKVKNAQAEIKCPKCAYINKILVTGSRGGKKPDVWLYH